MDDIVKRLRDQVSDDPVDLREIEIETLAANEIERLEQQLADATKRIGELEEGLRPFAEYAGRWDCYKSGNSSTPDTHELLNLVTLGDCRRARTLLQPSPSKEDPDVLAARYSRGGHHA
jgi:hypothetical protein